MVKTGSVKLLAMLLAVCMGVSALMGCGKPAGETVPTAAETTAATTQATEPPVEFFYMEGSRPNVNWKYPDGLFKETMDAQEIAALVPDDRYSCTGTATWDGTGRLLSITLRMEIEGNDLKIIYPVGGYMTPTFPLGELVVSPCNGVEYQVFQRDNSKTRCELTAISFLNETDVCVSMYSGLKELDDSRRTFEDVLVWLTEFEPGFPDVSQISYERIPEYFELELSKKEAYTEESFGHMLPKRVPSAYHTELGYQRYKDYREDYLMGEWRGSIKFLTWKVTYFTPEDEQRLVPSESALTVGDTVEDPVFQIEDVTIDLLKSRYEQERLDINVKIGEYIVVIRSTYATAEHIRDMLKSVQ